MPTVTVTFDTVTKQGTISVDKDGVADMSEFHMYLDDQGRGQIEMVGRERDTDNGMYTQTRVIASADGKLVQVVEKTPDELLLEVADRYTIATITQSERDKIPLEDFGWPAERKYPITSQATLDAAVKLIGKAPADMREKIKARIKTIARRKGLKVPESWGN